MPRETASKPASYYTIWQWNSVGAGKPCEGERGDTSYRLTIIPVRVLVNRTLLAPQGKEE